MRILRFSGVPGRDQTGVTRPVDVTLTWNAARPHEVGVHLLGDGYATTRWVFDRQLLAAGLTHPAGLGAVMVLPALWPTQAGPQVDVVLAAPHATIALPLPAEQLREFLDMVMPDDADADEAA